MKSCPTEVFEFPEAKILPSDFGLSLLSKRVWDGFALDAASPGAATDFPPARPQPLCECDPTPSCLTGNLHGHFVMTVKNSWFSSVDNKPWKRRDLFFCLLIHFSNDWCGCRLLMSPAGRQDGGPISSSSPWSQVPGCGWVWPCGECHILAPWALWREVRPHHLGL